MVKSRASKRTSMVAAIAAVALFCLCLPMIAIAEPSGSSASAEAAYPSAKDERVIVHARPDGSVKDIAVDVALKNEESAQRLTDVSVLHDIAGKDDNAFEQDGKTVVWVTKGDFVEYSGTSHDMLPIALKISYRLDGESIAPEELVGKSGRVEIEFSFENLSSQLVSVGGYPAKLYTPFAAITGMLLDADTFTDIEIDNGKIIEDGDRIIAVGYAFPGLQESLDLASFDLDVEIPSSFTLTAEVNAFEMGHTTTFVTTELFEGIDASKLGLSDFVDAGSELENAMSRLINGSSELSEGLDALSGGLDALEKSSSDLPEGLDALAQGSTSLSNALSSLTGEEDDDEGSLWALKNGTEQLREGTAGVADGMDKALKSLNEIEQALQDIDSALEIALENLETVESNVSDAIGRAEALESIVRSIIDDVRKAIQAIEGTDLDEATRDLVAASEAAARALGSLADVDVSGIQSARATLESVLASMDPSDPNYAAISDALDNLNSFDESSIVAAADAAQAARNYANAAVDSLGPVADALATLRDSLESKTDELREALEALAEVVNEEKLVETVTAFKTAQGYTDGAHQGIEELSEQLGIAIGNPEDEEGSFYALCNVADKLADGAQSVEEGMAAVIVAMEEQIIPGAQSLESALTELDASAPELINGIVKLSDGADQAAQGSHALTDALKAFDSEGIQRFVDMFGGELGRLSDRLDATAALAKDYDNFSGKPEGVDSSVVFIIETEALEA